MKHRKVLRLDPNNWKMGETIGIPWHSGANPHRGEGELTMWTVFEPSARPRFIGHDGTGKENSLQMKGCNGKSGG